MKKRLKYLFNMLHNVWIYDKAYVILRIIWDCIQSPLVSLLYIVMVQTMVNLLTVEAETSSIITALIIFGAIGFGYHIVGILLWKFFFTPREARIRAKMQNDMYNKLKKTDYKYFDTAEFYDVYTVTYANIVSKSFEAVGFISNFLGDLTSISALLTLIVNSNFIVIIIAIVSSILQAIIARKYNKLNIKRDDATSRISRENNYYRDTAISATADVKCTKIGDILMDRYCKGVAKLISINKKINKKEFNIDLIDQSIDTCVAFAIRATTCVFIAIGSIGIGSFVSMISAADQLAYKVRSITKYLDRFHKIVLDGERIETFLAMESPIEDAQDAYTEQLNDGPLDVEFKNVSFSYPKSDFSMKNISIRIKRGEKVAIVGENGGGKTTLTKLLLRLYDATSGEILINGKSIKNYSPSELRMNVGIAFQDTPVYSLSLRDNMSAYNEVDQKTFESVCNKIPLLKKILEKNEANIDSQITRSFDSKGIVLSGGEKQTISISRVLSKKFKMLIFDEPTSALDPVAADSMSKSIFDVKNDTTTVFISHKLSSVIDADHIYVFSNGEIVEDGTHISLMEKHGIYYNMFTAQADKYKAGLEGLAEKAVS